MYKRKVLILLVIIIIYIVLTYIYSVIMNTGVKDVYVLTKEVQRGEKLTLENTSKVRIDTTTSKIDYLENIDNLYAKYDLKKSQILNLDIVVNESEYLELASSSNEVVVIDLRDFQGNVQESFSAGMLVNLYYTGRTNQVENFFNNSNYKKVKSSSTSDSYTTALLVENIIVKEVYGKNGKITKDENIEKIALEVDNNMAIMIENIKNYGSFSITIKR